MSFSGDVKEECSRRMSSSRHCRIAEMAALLGMSGQVMAKGKDRYEIFLYTDNLPLARKFFYLVRRTFEAVCEIRVRSKAGTDRPSVILALRDETVCYQILSECGLLSSLESFGPEDGTAALSIAPEITERTCCKRAFIRGAFLAAGSVTDPEKAYHLEFVCLDETMAERVSSLLQSFEIESHIVRRTKYRVVYLKDGDQIVETLNVMEAHRSMMELENIRIMKEMRERVNRKVNCETANLQKAASAATQQKKDIEFLKSRREWNQMPENLREMALLRLQYPEASLKELGDLSNPPVGKSGVNHRLRKIREFAENLRKEGN